MKLTAEVVESAIVLAYSEDEQPLVRAKQSEYANYENFPAPHIQLAILALAQLVPPAERIAAIAANVQLVNLDPRDVLAAAESPEQIGAPHTRQEMREAYRQLGLQRPPL